MPRAFFKLCLVAAVVLLPAGAETNRSWEKLLATLKTGRKVVVTRMDGRKVEGELLSLASDSITVKAGSALRYSTSEQTTARNDVFRVRIADIRQRHTIIGMLVGAAGGAAIFGISASSGRANEFVGAVTVGGALLGLGPGAAVGGAVPIGPPLYEVTKDARTAWVNEHRPASKPAAVPEPAKR